MFLDVNGATLLPGNFVFLFVIEFHFYSVGKAALRFRISRVDALRLIRTTPKETRKWQSATIGHNIMTKVNSEGHHCAGKKVLSLQDVDPTQVLKTPLYMRSLDVYPWRVLPRAPAIRWLFGSKESKNASFF